MDSWITRCRFYTLVCVALTGAGLTLTSGCKQDRVKSGSAVVAPPGKKGHRGEHKKVRIPPKHARPAVPRHAVFPDAARAVKSILETHKPRVLGFGEIHQKTDSAVARSAVKRFAEQLLPLLAPRATDLLVETWVTEGRCGKQEKRVVKQVDKGTKRPKSTENEVLTLLKRGKKLGLKPHILVLSCADYKKLSGKDGKLDYEALLSTVTRHLKKKVEAIVGKQPKGAKKKAARERVLLVYGGALHNDLFPPKGLEMFSYASAAAKSGYVEIDLYVPEYLRGDKELAKQPWFPLLGKATSGQVVLIERGKRSYVLLLRRGVGVKAAGAKKRGGAKTGATKTR
jgi:hypothetical protein